MTSLTIYDPAMCCSTGICGADIDQRLVDFASDLDWLKSQGIDVSRINLSQEPALFAENEIVKSVLEKSGVEGLPVIIADDVLMSSAQYPSREKLAEMAGLSNDQNSSSSHSTTKSSQSCGGSGDQKEKPANCC